MKKDINKQTSKSEMILTILIVLILIGTFLGLSLFSNNNNQKPEVQSYTYRYAFVAESLDDDFTNSVYEEVARQAESADAYVERVGKSLHTTYTKHELMRVAIDSKPDAIIVQGDDSSIMQSLINEAVSNGIFVVTFMTDSQDSDRDCFVGPNYYDMGRRYGSIIATMNKDNPCDIMVIHLQDTLDTSLRSFDTGISSALGKKKSCHIQERGVEGIFSFDIEEAVKAIVKNECEDIDVIICLDENVTSYVYNAVVDLNRVGNADIIGYYCDENVIKGIKNGVLLGSVTVDAKTMGKSIVGVIEENRINGYVSDYIATPIGTIDESNVDEYIEVDEEAN